MKLIPDFNKKYGRLKITRILPRLKGQLRVEAICDCGAVKQYNFTNLKKGTTRSCGCYHIHRCIEAATKHGMSHKSKAWRAWTKIRARCGNPDSPDWKDYGGRGISVCHEWKESFPQFLADMGEAPSQSHSIDRINNDGDYEPGNCRWATAKEQARNRRTTRPVVAGGESMWICDWANKLGVGRATIRRRIKLFGSPYGNPNWKDRCRGMPKTSVAKEVDSTQALREA